MMKMVQITEKDASRIATMLLNLADIQESCGDEQSNRTKCYAKQLLSKVSSEQEIVSHKLLA